MGKRHTASSLLIFLSLTAASFAFAGPPEEITVSAAISLKNAFEEIGKLYKSRLGTDVIFNFGASGDLMKQIAAGAPVDVFASAAQKDMDDLGMQDLLVESSRADFAANTIVLITPISAKSSPKSFRELTAAEFAKIAIGNPKTVPAGRYAEEIFAFFQIGTLLKDRLIYTENVRQVLDYVARGEVDAGIVYATDAIARAKEIKVVATAPESSHRPVVYPIAVVKGTKKEANARSFLSLVLSPEGEKILHQYGFRTRP